MKCTVFVTALFVYVVTIGVDGAKDDHVYLMEVKLPTLENRGEDIEIYHINQFLGSSYGVNDIYRFKVDAYMLLLVSIRFIPALNHSRDFVFYLL